MGRMDWSREREPSKNFGKDVAMMLVRASQHRVRFGLGDRRHSRERSRKLSCFNSAKGEREGTREGKMPDAQ